MNTKSVACRVLLAVAFCGLSVACFADEHHHHHWHHRYDHDGFDGSFGIYFGSPFYDDPFYSDDDPYYSYLPPAYYVAPRPRVYIQRSQPQPPRQRQPQQYWYWCKKPAGYYPYIKQCPTPWKPIVPYGTPPA